MQGRNKKEDKKTEKNDKGKGNNKLKDNDPHQTRQVDFYPNSSTTHAFTDNIAIAICARERVGARSRVLCVHFRITVEMPAVSYSRFVYNTNEKIIETTTQKRTASATAIVT